ncbi:MAG: NAD(P)H-dependent oxidoreductase [Thermodesulfobacteriota bacterium]|nr:NAD(P)H-dependent oxidoreductase [Thermodesulfobacteriota bacterium]
MNCLVVRAHPLDKSLCAEMTRVVTEMLQAAGHSVIIEDLYEQGFGAAMTPQERESYYAESYDTQGVSGQIERLKAAEAIVLVFPTWWFGFPAILKGWFDRVWAPGTAYDHAPGFGPIQPRLHELRRMLVITSLGAPWWVDYFILRQPVKRVLKTAIVGTCAPRCRLQMLSVYKCEDLSPSQVDKFCSRIQRALAEW